jgi:sugar lactone lactonase YvrE
VLNHRFWIVLGAVSVGLAASAPTDVTLHEDKPFPESLTSTSEGALIIGSLAKGEVLRAPKGAATAEVWIKPGTNGLQRVLGVLADQRSGTLWVCSSKLPPNGAPTALKTFDLKTGAPKGGYDFPGDNALCNDIAIGPDGTAYATDTTANRIMRLKKGASANDTIYVNTVTTGHLFRIPVSKDGAAGAIAQLKPSQELSRPDGMRTLGKNQFLLIEGVGRLDRVTIEGDNAKIEVLKDGFNGPTAVTQTGNTAWVLEGKLNYMQDPKLKDQDPGPFKAQAVPLAGKH